LIRGFSLFNLFGCYLSVGVDVRTLEGFGVIVAGLDGLNIGFLAWVKLGVCIKISPTLVGALMEFLNAE
jgi:hypothetical protein